jgi:hypothetical protein
MPGTVFEVNARSMNPCGCMLKCCNRSFMLLKCAALYLQLSICSFLSVTPLSVGIPSVDIVISRFC